MGSSFAAPAESSTVPVMATPSPIRSRGLPASCINREKRSGACNIPNGSAACANYRFSKCVLRKVQTSGFMSAWWDPAFTSSVHTQSMSVNIRVASAAVSCLNGNLANCIFNILPSTISRIFPSLFCTTAIGITRNGVVPGQFHGTNAPHFTFLAICSRPNSG